MLELGLHVSGRFSLAPPCCDNSCAGVLAHLMSTKFLSLMVLLKTICCTFNCKEADVTLSCVSLQMYNLGQSTNPVPYPAQPGPYPAQAVAATGPYGVASPGGQQLPAAMSGVQSSRLFLGFEPVAEFRVVERLRGPGEGCHCLACSSRFMTSTSGLLDF